MDPMSLSPFYRWEQQGRKKSRHLSWVTGQSYTIGAFILGDNDSIWFDAIKRVEGGIMASWELKFPARKRRKAILSTGWWCDHSWTILRKEARAQSVPWDANENCADVDCVSNLNIWLCSVILWALKIIEFLQVLHLCIFKPS